MLYLTCTTIFSVDLAHYGVPRAKDWVSGDCGTSAVSSPSIRDWISLADSLISAAACAENSVNKFTSLVSARD